jgi:peptidoglycan/xylan/chitin deacetylase (PgdA/CDA1 family)
MQPDLRGSAATSAKLKVIFLAGRDCASTRQSIEAVCRLSGVEPLGVILIDERFSPGERLGRVFRYSREREWSSTILQVLEGIASTTTTLVNNAAVSQVDVSRVLRQAFPDRCSSMTDLGRRHNIKIEVVENLNSSNILRALKENDADLGIALGTRAFIADAAVFPVKGWITVQEGVVGEGREISPGFWEIYEGKPAADVSVRLTQSGAVRGDVIARSPVTIQAWETPDSLLEKLNYEASRVVVSAVALIRDGKAAPLHCDIEADKPRREPTREEVILLQRRLPHWVKNSAVSTIVRNLYVLFVYYSGIYFAVRQWHRLSRSRAAIILYHRVNDYAKDVLTVDCKTFAAQLLAISQRYRVSSTADMVARLRAGKPLVPTTVAIHFDDCYQDILMNGAPIMKACGVPACAFINSGFIDTNRTFAHDAESPYTFPMLRSSDVQSWVDMGFEVGAHTINHVDLGTCPVEDAKPEIIQCGVELEKLIGKPVDLFAFPFGKPHHIRAATLEIIRSGSYVANFSAHGGYIDSGTDLFDIPRGGAHFESSPVYCLLQIEGLTLSRLARKLRGGWKRPAAVAIQG